MGGASGGGGRGGRSGGGGGGNQVTISVSHDGGADVRDASGKVIASFISVGGAKNYIKSKGLNYTPPLEPKKISSSAPAKSATKQITKKLATGKQKTYVDDLAYKTGTDIKREFGVSNLNKMTSKQASYIISRLKSRPKALRKGDYTGTLLDNM